ncbi:uncharacterized protein O3C94_007053 [Discoglossus pictus]
MGARQPSPCTALLPLPAPPSERGDISVTVKAKDPRLQRKLTVTEFVLAFGIFRDVICSVFPHRRQELDDHLHLIVDLAYRYGGFAYYDYHRSFAAKAAATLSQFNLHVNWALMDHDLFYRLGRPIVYLGTTPICNNFNTGGCNFPACSKQFMGYGFEDSAVVKRETSSLPKPVIFYICKSSNR